MKYAISQSRLLLQFIGRPKTILLALLIACPSAYSAPKCEDITNICNETEGFTTKLKNCDEVDVKETCEAAYSDYTQCKNDNGNKKNLGYKCSWTYDPAVISGPYVCRTSGTQSAADMCKKV